MSAEVVLGLDAVLTIDGAEIKNVKDLTVNLEKAEADASTRDNNGWRATVGTLKDASIEFTVLNKNGDTSFSMLQTLWSSGTPCDIDISDVGGSLTLTCEVMTFNVNQNLEEVVSADVTLKPTQSATGNGINVPVGSGT
ncbi:phage tail tube protein [Aporhodopirellula aestuarii]|uniref:Phage tail tube protein n=1 Tax=Aporhodopirellula aestuarii TaxID=2950107 RepID=A0ABT0U1L0_9BACT|nr:phage tail tube protein [Aporhodopirellula aestuarii]MCM2370671.1 phage tail tube protein [Aporhodopirellula aestuarii]